MSSRHQMLIRLILSAYDPADELEPRERTFMVKQVIHSLATEGSISEETLHHIQTDMESA